MIDINQILQNISNGPGFLTSYAMVLFMFNDLMCEMIVCFAFEWNFPYFISAKFEFIIFNGCYLDNYNI
jgi:hypothetical protein